MILFCYFSDKRLGFSRISDDGKITIAINCLMNRQIIPKMIFEFFLFHQLRRATFPFDPLGLQFVHKYHHLFSPSDSARIEIEKPELKLMYQMFLDSYRDVSGTSDNGYDAFCRGFLMGYGSIIGKDEVYMWY